MGIFNSISGQQNEGDRLIVERQTSKTGKEKDPVCKMDVDPATAAAKSEYKGKTYYFCAVGCKKTFDADPEKYIGGE